MRYALFAMLLVGPLFAQDVALKADATKALKSAATYYRDKVASHGGYVYYYSLDLKDRWGEGKASPDILFVQPPGTPTVGMAYLAAHAATGDQFYLDAARETAECLVYGQLQSGGWTQTIHYAKANRMGKYRNGKGGNWNASSLDDDQTQAALRMLMRLDKALEFKNAEIHDAAEYGLKALLKAQFPNGAFPQIWIAPVAAHPVKKASYPKWDYRTEGKLKNYYDHYTLNDGLAGTVADVLIVAHEVYKDDKYKKAVAKLGDFLVLAQMPDPQPGWCQQYNFDMEPIWARKFEPPAITTWESQDAMETLIRIARVTGEKKYLDPIEPARRYFGGYVSKEGTVPRFIEFVTHRPLYMNSKYELTYDDSDVPAHYGWTQPARFDRIEKAYESAKKGEALPKPKTPTAEEVKKVIAALDADGRWVSEYAGERLVGQPKFDKGFKYLSSETFGKNVETLAAYLK
jgi:PelA/Pel-15E family pectate lyase